MMQDRKSFVGWLQAAPMMLIFALFFLLPLVFVTIVSAWDYNEYELIPAFSLRGYTDTFEGCVAGLPDLCTILRTYLKTVKLCLLTWSLTLLIGFTVAYFLAFHVRSKTWQIVLTLLCTIPFWTSNVIRMIAWIPLLGRNGLVNTGLQSMGLIQQPLEWLLFSEFSVVLALVHLFTFFMVVPIFNSMIRIDKRLIEAAYDAGATGWQTLVNIIIPLAKPGIVIGSIFVITIVMGDFVTIGVIGGKDYRGASQCAAISGCCCQLGHPARHHDPDHFVADPDRRYPQGTLRWARKGRDPFMCWRRVSLPTCCFCTGRCLRSTFCRFRDPMAA
jgi:putative spermidine/putrescine transport system permease protein